MIKNHSLEVKYYLLEKNCETMTLEEGRFDMEISIFAV